MIKIENLSYSFPQKELFQNISFTIEAGQHCAFIGTNGSGKSTLINMIMDPEQYLFDGKLEIDASSRIGYVSQFSQLDASNEMTVFEYLAAMFIEVQAEIDAICEEMATAQELDLLLEKYQQKLDLFQSIDGDNYESNISKKLYLANLVQHADLAISKLSGGEFKLVQIIKEMLTAPNLIIMDEPDVFLDFENLNSLKNLINSHKGMMLVITHNRYLLNHCFNKIIHLENKELQEYDGRYIDYNFKLLQTKIELQELAMADTEEIERNEIIVNQLRAIASTHADASRGRSLHARVKMLERLEARRIKEPFVTIKQPQIELATTNPLEDTVALKVNQYTVGYETLLLENVSFEINAKDKVAIVGANGTGKTTLLRDIYENKLPTIEINEKINAMFFSQLQNKLPTESTTILDEFFNLGFQSYDEIDGFLSKYGFEREILSNRMDALSGGEKMILQIAKLSVSSANMLLLDEPTSHLDTYSQIALEQAIANYNGTVLMISHDFYSVVNCVDYILLIEDKTIRRVSMRKFRKMIYERHFDKDYLEIEKKKKDFETRIAQALQNRNFELAKSIAEELEKLLVMMK